MQISPSMNEEGRITAFEFQGEAVPGGLAAPLSLVSGQSTASPPAKSLRNKSMTVAQHPLCRKGAPNRPSRCRQSS